MPKLSVIVPIYGVEKYIERCARSLFEQTLDDIEFIFVDDCTPDNSMQILANTLKEYPHRIKQTKIIQHKQNKGLPVARQSGIKVATGEYIAHCDSDDWVDIEMYKKMYDSAISNHADVVVCDYITTDNQYFNNKTSACHCTSPQQLVTNCLLQKDPWSLWNKLFNRNVYSNIIFPKGSMGEDMTIVIQLLLKCKSLSYITDPLYFYFYNTTSITKKMDRESCIRKAEQLFANADIVLNTINCNKEYLKNSVKVLTPYKNTIRASLYPLLGEKKYYNLWNNIYPGLNLKVFFSFHISVLEKIRVLLAILHLYPRKRNRV